MDTLSGAFCVYLLTGYLWGSLYGLIYLLAPGSFRLPLWWTPGKEQGNATDVPVDPTLSEADFISDACLWHPWLWFN